MVFEPTFRGMAAEAKPGVVAVPLTVTVALGSLVAGVAVIEVVVLDTLAV